MFWKIKGGGANKIKIFLRKSEKIIFLEFHFVIISLRLKKNKQKKKHLVYTIKLKSYDLPLNIDLNKIFYIIFIKLSI